MLPRIAPSIAPNTRLSFSSSIEHYLAVHNDNPRPFEWTATADQILAKVRRGRVTLDAITN